MSNHPIFEAPTGNLRLTPRGVFVIRLLLLGGVLVGLGMLIASFWFQQSLAPAAAADEQSAGRYQEIMVQPGDTLWDISSRVTQANEQAAVLEQIMVYNDLETSELEVGQTLYIPLADN